MKLLQFKRPMTCVCALIFLSLAVSSALAVEEQKYNLQFVGTSSDMAKVWEEVREIDGFREGYLLGSSSTVQTVLVFLKPENPISQENLEKSLSSGSSRYIAGSLKENDDSFYSLRMTGVT